MNKTITGVKDDYLSFDKSNDKSEEQTFRLYSITVEVRAWRLLGLLFVTFFIWLGFHFWTDGVFLTPRNLSNLTVQMTITALLSIGITWLLVAREIDLSVGAILAVTAVVALKLQVKADLSTLLTIILVFIIGISIGALQGSLRIWAGIPSFIVTLAGFSWLRGMAYVISGAETLSGTNEFFYQIANSYLPSRISIFLLIAIGLIGLFSWVRPLIGGLQTMNGQKHPIRIVNIVSIVVFIISIIGSIWIFQGHKGIPTPLIILGIVAGCATYINKHTAFGRHIFAVGGSPEGARRAGISVNWLIFSLFVIMGGLSALAGVIQASRLDAGPPNLGQFLALDAISASIVGGTSLFGGIGSIGGAVLGAMLMTSITNGLSLAGVNTFYQLIVTGSLLICAVGLDMFTQKRLKI
jgi:D-xylose transport system permease protein